ncbi:shikimate dehydrogenase [bacterium]|nr:shikimate dehydrogenase [bacterium]
MAVFGLIGYPLSHSKSPEIFNSIFEEANASEHHYKLFPLKSLKELNKVLNKEPDLTGFNITIPYKKEILSQLYEIDQPAVDCWAVNTVKVSRMKGRVLLKGFNTDLPAFKESLEKLLKPQHSKALVLGSGGAASAAKVALKQLGIDFQSVSRQMKFDALQYSDVDNQVLKSHKLVVNCTPLGMYPNSETCPDLPFQSFTEQHLVYDMVYNPTETLLMKRARAQGAQVQNGLEMLKLQARKAWDIWNN